MKKGKPALCPNEDEHTPHPSGYIDHEYWAEEMLKTHEQLKCKGCGLWTVWVSKEALNER